MRRPVAAALAALLLPLGLAPPAHADVRVVPDAVGDGGGRDGRDNDVERVRVRHAPRQLALRVVMAETGSFAHFYDVWVDTDARRAGPERVVTVSFEVLPRVGVQETDGFGDLGGAGRCEVRTARARFRTGVLTFSVPRRCLATDGVVPRRVRVGVEASGETGRHDWVPGTRRFGRWVVAG